MGPPPWKNDGEKGSKLRARQGKVVVPQSSRQWCWVQNDRMCPEDDRICHATLVGSTRQKAEASRWETPHTWAGPRILAAMLHVLRIV
jgi:hypothetical protein